MTNTSKWVTVGVGFGICYYIGWFFPLLWFMYLVLIIVVVMAVPTKPSADTPLQKSELLPSSEYDISEIEAALQARADVARNDDVREGILDALSVVRDQVSVQAAAAPVSSDFVFDEPIVSSLSKSEIAAVKQQQELRNINTILYVACFLLVGAAALFIGFSTNLPATLKFAAVLLVAVVFYVAGLLLHSQSKRLRPAAVAFVGTGLALIPFVGLAFYSYVITDASLVWWLTSVVGLAAFWLALLRIQAQVMGYLTLAFVFSLATSSVSVLHVPFVWYFVAIIVTSTVLTYLGYKKPRWLPTQLLMPLEQNAQLATPVALIGSLFLVGTLSTFDYALISGIAALHYAVNALGFSTDRTRYVYWVLARALSIVFALTLTYYFTESWQWVSTTLAVSAIIVHFYAITTITKQKLEEGWLWFAQVAVLFALCGWLENMVQVSAGLVILLALSLYQLDVMKRMEFALLGIMAAMILPITLLRSIIEPAVSYEYIGLIVGLMAVSCLAARAALQSRHIAYQTAASIAYAVFTAEALLLVTVSAQWLWLGSLATAAGVLLYLASYVEKQPLLHIPSNIITAIGVALLYKETLSSDTWVPLATAWTLGLLWYALSWYFQQSSKNDSENIRIDTMFVSTVIILLFAAIITIASDDVTVPAGALTGCLAAALFAYEGYVRRLTIFYEVALYVATVSLQFLVGNLYPDASFLVYTHWWALTGAAAAALYLNKGDHNGAVLRGVLALTAISVPTGLFALSNPDRYQLLFLLEHAVLAIGGLATNKKLVVQWGAIGIGLAVLWLLRGYSYVLLTVLALALIGFAVWRLMKKSS